METLKAPFPWFGGKRKVASLVWSRFGNVQNYVEPFFGSGAVLLGRPTPFAGVETVNDLDGFVANFWRSIKLSPDETAKHADNPVNENDLHARHIWLVNRREELRSRLEGDPDFHDPRIAGYWVWGLSCWIAGGWCSGRGPWALDEESRLVKSDCETKRVKRQLVHLGSAGQGINRSLQYLRSHGQGINQSLGVPIQDRFEAIRREFVALSARLREVRVASGDWARVTGPTVTLLHGTTAVFLDPPYADTANRDPDIYAHDSLDVAHDVREWAIEAGRHKEMRIALCGYDGEHEMPPEWSVVEWNAGEGYGGRAEERTGNGKRERIWFSPHCLADRQGRLF